MKKNEERLKIAFLMQEKAMGGIEYNSYHLAKALDHRFQVTFFCPGEGKLTRHLRASGLPYILYRRPSFFSTSMRIWGRTVFNPLATLYNLMLFPCLAWRLSLRLRNFDLAITKGLLVNFYGSLACRWAGIPCIWDMQEIVSRKRCLGIFNAVLNLWGIFADFLIAPSEAIRAQFFPSLRKRTLLIPNGIDTEAYGPHLSSSPVREEWGVRSDEILIGHIARFTYWKGQMDFVQAASQVASRLPNARFVLVGSPVFDSDGYEREVKDLVKRLGLEGRALFPGFREDLGPVLAALDIFVHSSIEPEGCPLTLLTAMAVGKPVIASHVLGNSEIISAPDQALLVPPGNPSALAEAMLRISQDSNLARLLGTNARERILERYSIQVYGRDTGMLLEKVARRKQDGPKRPISKPG